jgi:hypothetical protein
LRSHTVSNSADSRPQDGQPGRAVRTSMLLVGVLVAGVFLLHQSTSLKFHANTQVERGPPIVKASDRWIRLGVEASSSQVPIALSQYEVIQPIEPKQTRPRRKDRGMQATSRGSRGIHSHAQSSRNPVRWSVASACQNVTKRGVSDAHNFAFACPSNRKQVAAFRVVKNQRHWSRPSAPT